MVKQQLVLSRYEHNWDPDFCFTRISLVKLDIRQYLSAAEIYGVGNKLLAIYFFRFVTKLTQPEN